MQQRWLGGEGAVCAELRRCCTICHPCRGPATVAVLSISHCRSSKSPFFLQPCCFYSELLSYILFLRVTPLLPNTFINLASPVVGVPPLPFVFGKAVWRIAICSLCRSVLLICQGMHCQVFINFHPTPPRRQARCWGVLRLITLQSTLAAI